MNIGTQSVNYQSMNETLSSVAKAASGLSLANEARLLRNGFSGAILLVEGPKDKLVYQKFLKVGDVKVLPGLCRENVTRAVKILNDTAAQGVLGLVDRDFENPNRRSGVAENIIYTEENDLEMMILCSPAFDAVLEEYGSQAKIDLVVSQRRIGARDILFVASAAIGVLRAMSKEKSWNLRFAGMSYQFATRRGIEISVERQYEHLKARTGVSPSWSSAEVAKAAVGCISRVGMVQELCHGHDTVRLLGRAFRSVFGSISEFDSSRGAESLERVLRLAYEERYFRRSATYSDMREWETERGYHLFGGDDVF